MRALWLFPPVVLLAVFAAYDAAVAFWRTRTDEQAPPVIALDSGIRTTRNERPLVSPETDSSRIEKIRRDAESALIDEPLNYVAMRQLGMIASLRKKSDGFAQFSAAERISRRDLANQMLLIEHKVRSEDIAGIVSHYDRALATNPDSSEILFPVLVQALSEPDIRAALSGYARRPWFATFIGSAVAQGGDASAVRMLFVQTQKQMPKDVSAQTGSYILNQLTARQHYADARALALAMAGEQAISARAFGFSQATTDSRLASLAWNLTISDVAEASLADENGLAIRVASEQTSLVANRLTMLEPKTYELQQTLSYEANSPPARLAWEMRCLPDTSSVPVWRFAAAATEGKNRSQARLSLPQGCETQAWSLIATAATTQSDSTVVISELTLSPL